MITQKKTASPIEDRIRKFVCTGMDVPEMKRVEKWVEVDPSYVVLRQLQIRMMGYYKAYRKGELSEEAYLSYIGPIDRLIDKIELSILDVNIGKITPPDTPALKGSF